ncbi:MAG: 7-cyano-7-deazaguanine synthase QueC [Planctomycetota bacterium]
MARKKAVALLSGGIDSATAAAVLHSQGFDIFPLAIRYGQRHSIEIEAAERLAKKLQFAPLKIITIDLRAIGGSALTEDIHVPKGRAIDANIPVTYVPARNTIFLSIALGYAETLGAFDITIGANALDYSGYPDCRHEFLRAFESLANVATKAGVEGFGKFKIHAPLLELTKAEIIQLAVEKGVPLEDTHSCYDPSEAGAACGECDSCILRKKGFAEAGVEDVTRYR